MEQYRREQEKQTRNSRVAGGTLALCLLAVFYIFLFFHGYKYLDPPRPDESLITLDFTEKVEHKIKPKQETKGTKPTAENPDQEKPIELIKHSEAQEKGVKQNISQESTVDDFGDVEKTEPPRKKEIKKKSLYTSANNVQEKDTLKPQTSSQPSDKLKEGHSQGNIKDGNQTGTPNAHLKGRSVIGAIKKPDCDVTESGRVVVWIKVDRNGSVIDARPGHDGTTLTSKAAWDAAVKAAMETHFNVKDDAPEYQYGTITYIFNIVK